MLIFIFFYFCILSYGCVHENFSIFTQTNHLYWIRSNVIQSNICGNNGLEPFDVRTRNQYLTNIIHIFFFGFQCHMNSWKNVWIILFWRSKRRKLKKILFLFWMKFCCSRFSHHIEKILEWFRYIWFATSHFVTSSWHTI